MRNFRKTNGQSGEHMGVKVYRVTFDAEVEFIRDAYAPSHAFLPWCALPVSSTSNSKAWGESYAQAGEVRKVSGQIDFSHSENGWSVDDIQRR